MRQKNGINLSLTDNLFSFAFFIGTVQQVLSAGTV